jgi:hypothetical protein
VKANVVGLPAGVVDLVTVRLPQVRRSPWAKSSRSAPSEVDARDLAWKEM